MYEINPSVDGYIRKNKQWQHELSALRELLLGSGLTEEVKWRVPCYTRDGANVAFIGPLKSSCVLSFVKGALLKDPNKILVQQTANSQTVRVIRFANVAEITAAKATISAYIKEAIEVEKAGPKVEMKKVTDWPVPEELQKALADDEALAKAFKILTPGRQRAYLMHIAGAKQSKTRTARIDKHRPRILAGKGLDDD